MAQVPCVELPSPDDRQLHGRARLVPMTVTPKHPSDAVSRRDSIRGMLVRLHGFTEDSSGRHVATWQCTCADGTVIGTVSLRYKFSKTESFGPFVQSGKAWFTDISTSNIDDAAAARAASSVATSAAAGSCCAAAAIAVS